MHLKEHEKNDNLQMITQKIISDKNTFGNHAQYMMKQDDILKMSFKQKGNETQIFKNQQNSHK